MSFHYRLSHWIHEQERRDPIKMAEVRVITDGMNRLDVVFLLIWGLFLLSCAGVLAAFVWSVL